MLVDVTKVLTSMNGDALLDVDKDGTAVEVTVKAAIVNAVLMPVQNEKGVEKLVKFELAKKVHNGTEVNLNEDEIKLIKDRVGDVYAPLIVGQIFELLQV